MEQENDLLVCGDCQTSFPLHDIVLFIKHKNHGCCTTATNTTSNKENGDSGCCTSHDDDDVSQDDGEEPKDLSLPSGTRKASRQEDPLADRKSGLRLREEPMEEGSGEWPRKPLRPRQVDAGANTTHSGRGVCVWVWVWVCVCVCVCVCLCLSVCLSSLVCVVGLFLCTLMRYIGFMGVLFSA